MDQSRKAGLEEQWAGILGRCNERVDQLEALARIGSEALAATGGALSVTQALAMAAEGGAFNSEDIEALRLATAREALSELERHARDRQIAVDQELAIERLTRALATEVDRRVRAEVDAAQAQARAERAVAYASRSRLRLAQAEEARNVALQALRDLTQEIFRRLPGAARTRMFDRALAVLDGAPGRGAPSPSPAAPPVASERPATPDPIAPPRSGEAFAVAARVAEFERHIEVAAESDAWQARADAPRQAGLRRARRGKPAVG